jgi:K+-transporting ATPase A subunit
MEVAQPHAVSDMLSGSVNAPHDLQPLLEQALAQAPSTVEIVAAVTHADVGNVSHLMQQLGNAMGTRLAVLRPLDPVAFASLATSLTTVVDSVHEMLNAEAVATVQQSLVSISLASQQVAAAVGENGSGALLPHIAVPMDVPAGTSCSHVEHPPTALMRPPWSLLAACFRSAASYKCTDVARGL